MSSRPPITNLDQLKDVTLSSPADGQALIYKATSLAWLNQSIPGGSLATLNDTAIVTPSDKQLLQYSAASSKWLNYGPLAFTDITGNIVVAQMAGGSGANGATFFRGDGTWASPTGAAAGTTNTVMKSDGLNWVASPETYDAPGTAGNRMISDGTNWISAPPVSTSYINASLSNQTLAAGELYLAGSTITLPAGAWKAGGIYHCTFDILKTAAGTAGIIINVRMGTLGTLGDALVGTISYPAGTANLDLGYFDVYITFRSVGSGTSAAIITGSRHTKSATAGLGLSVLQTANTALSSGFNSTTATRLGITFTGGTAFSATNSFVQTDYKQ